MTQPLAAAPRASAGHAPPLRAGSVRRTSSIDVTWPDADRHTMCFDARGRDLLVPGDGAANRVQAWDRVWATLNGDRTIRAIRSEPARAGLQDLVGARGGSYLRSALEAALPDPRDRGSPLYLLIDDFAGASLVGPWAWLHWPAGGARPPAIAMDPQTRGQALARMLDVCIGFKEGSTGLRDIDGSIQNHAEVLPLPNPDDPEGWHELPAVEARSFRRARRIDVWREPGLIRIDAMFQDSAGIPGQARRAVHEYGLQVSADAQTLRLTSIAATPRILPYPECPSAVANTGRMLGVALAELRSAVLERLPRNLGCTHLNDALRSLAEVPVLLAALDASV